ncbi:MAG: hypothetical protein ACOCZ5_00845 [bacterium]
MYIHNLYNDMMVSVSILLDKIIFNDSKYIARYEFNLGNRTFQLGRDPKVNIDFPVAIVTINDENSSFGQRTETIKQFTNPNFNNIPVLYNKTNRTALYLNEESTQIPINITINTESQLQAKEISHIIRRYLPLNKLIRHFEFNSFLEIDTKYLLSNELFDPYNHDIINLFSKFDKLLGKTDFCFSVRYNPFIRLDSISASAPDSSQRTYQVSIDITYVLQWPMYVYNDKENIIENINISISAGELHPLSFFSAIRLFDDGRKVRNYMIYDGEDVLNLTDNEFVYYTIQPEKNYIDVSDKNNIYNFISMLYNKTLDNLTPETIIEEDNQITFKILREDYYNYFTPSIRNPIILQVLYNK